MSKTPQEFAPVTPFAADTSLPASEGSCQSSHFQADQEHIPAPGVYTDLSQAALLVGHTPTALQCDADELDPEPHYQDPDEHQAPTEMEQWGPSVLFPGKDGHPSLRIELREARGKSRVVSSAYMTSIDDSLIVYAERALRKKRGGECR